MLSDFESELQGRILEAFGNPSLEALKEACSERVKVIRDAYPRFGIRWCEEEDWLAAFAERDADTDDLLQRMSIYHMHAPLSIRFLPFFMTVETTERWKLGRGPFDCGLCPDSAFQNQCLNLFENNMNWFTRLLWSGLLRRNRDGKSVSYQPLVEYVSMHASIDVKRVVCDYVQYCASYYETFALDAWENYWKDVSESLEDSPSAR